MFVSGALQAEVTLTLPCDSLFCLSRLTSGSPTDASASASGGESGGLGRLNERGAVSPCDPITEREKVFYYIIILLGLLSPEIARFMYFLTVDSSIFNVFAISTFERPVRNIFSTSHARS